MYVIVAGGGLLGQGVAQGLAEGRHDVVVIERDRAVCEQLSSRMGVLAVNGAATDVLILEEAGVRKADVAVGALPSDADNLSFGVLARSFEVPRVLVRMRDPQYADAYKLAGVYRAMNISGIFVSQLVLEIEQPSVRQVATFGAGKASIVVLTIPRDAAVHDMTVADIAVSPEFPNNCVIAGIFRAEADEFVFPRGKAVVRSGDQVFLAAPTENVRAAVRFLRRK